MKGNEVLALICKAQNAEHFTEFSAKGFFGGDHLPQGGLIHYAAKYSNTLVWKL